MTNGEQSWWEHNRKTKRQLDLPEYEPPRFNDGVYTHAIVDRLEDRFGCTIRFIGYNTTYPDDWSVEVDGVPVMQIGRYRDENGNTIYELNSDEFENRLVSVLDA